MPIDLKSPLITGLSLSLLLRADAPWLHAAAMIAIGSKFVLRVDGKHVFNPAGLAIVVLLFTTNGVWISPGQWGTEIWFASLAGLFAILVLSASRRVDIAVYFFPATPRFCCCVRPGSAIPSRLCCTSCRAARS